jgi:signal transduction histidine kinase
LSLFTVFEKITGLKKSRLNPVKASVQGKPFKEIYLILNDKLKILDCGNRLAKDLSIKSVTSNSKQFFLLFSKSDTQKLKSLISKVIKTKQYQQTESRIKFDNRSLIYSIDIIPWGNSALILIKDITKKKDIVGKLKKSQKQLRDLANHLQNIREEERRYFAREIHDDFGQKLTALQIEVGLLLKKIKNTGFKIDTKLLHKRLQSLNKIVNDTLDSKKLLLSKFRLDFLEEMGLIEAVRHYLEEFQARYNIEYYFYSDWKYLDLSYAKSVALYRVVQEALTNVARHSGATKVDVSLEDRGDKLFLIIEDNGIGITAKDIKNTVGFGVIGMEERILLISGNFSIKGKPGKGTRLQASIKLK